MPKRQKKIKTCDPFCPQSQKDAEVKPKGPEHLPYNPKMDEKIPRSLRTLQFLMEQSKEIEAQKAEQKTKPKQTTQRQLTESQLERKENLKLTKQIKADEKELQRLLKEKKRLEKMLK